MIHETSGLGGVVLRRNIEIALLAVGILWMVYVADIFLPVDLRYYGIRPRHVDGLWGILFSPFLHGDARHLMANTAALFALLLMSLSFSRKLTSIAVVSIAVIGGGLVWVFGGSHTVHIGASGIIFGLIGFLMFSGIFRREWRALLVSWAVLFLYGGALYSLLVYVPGVSWTGHFFGFFSGVLTAWWTREEK